MTVSSPNVIELKLERLIDDMRLLRSQMIAFDSHLKGISDGRARAKARGVQFGRPSKLTAYQRQEALKRLQEGHAQTDVARLLNVSQPTISRVLGDRPFEASAGDAAQP